MPRLRELDLTIGSLPTGRFNAITDVLGVQVGHATIIEGDGPLVPGRGPVRTGVTVIIPHSGNLFLDKVPAAVHTINGYGKVAGFEQVRELGVLEAPVALTNTLNVGLVLDALVQHALLQTPEIGVSPASGSVNVVVGETNDSFLNDMQGRHVKPEHVFSALHAAAGGEVAEGCVGAGAGTVCYGWKGGIGAASRALPDVAGGYTVGALVQTNFGSRSELVIAGAPIGRILGTGSENPVGAPGSVMVVLATNAPLDSRQLHRLCVRAAAGLARTGAVYSHGSGDFVIAFSTALRIAHKPLHLLAERTVLADEAFGMNYLFRAVVECVEEAVLNSMFNAHTVVGRDGHIVHQLPVDRVADILSGVKDWNIWTKS